MNIKIIKFDNFYKLPERKHYNDAGADIYISNNYRIAPLQTLKIKLGFGLELPDGYCATIITRSSKASLGYHVHMSPIDSGYRGEIHCIITNLTTEEIFINKDDRIGQIVILPIIIANFIDVDLKEREKNGLGSTDNVQ